MTNPTLSLRVFSAGVVAMLVGWVAPSVAAQPLPPTPRMVEVQGRTVRVMTAGFDHLSRGQLVVVFESGANTALQNRGSVFTDVAAFAPVVAYDRSGIGESPWDGEPPTPARRVAQLRALLAELGAPPPYVLVGHSWGGPLIRVFAGHHPDEVAGLVYVDPLDFSQSIADGQAINDSLGLSEDDPAMKRIDEMQRSAMAQMPPGRRAEMEQVSTFVGVEGEARGLGPEPAVPLVVLLGAKYEPPPWGAEAPFDLRVVFDAMTQQRLRSMSAWALAAPEGLLVLANHAGHYVHQDDPALLTDAIRRVVFPGIPRQLRDALATGDDVAATYRALVRRYPPERFEENLLNALGYELLRATRVDDAIAVFELNVEAYPRAPNPYDSLGDAYSAAGRLVEARDSYARAVARAEATGHPNLSTYRANLDRVTRQIP